MALKRLKNHGIVALKTLISPRNTALGIAVIGAFLFAAKGVIAKLLYREGIDATTLLGLRMLLSAPFFALIAAYTWRNEPRLTLHDGWKIAGLGFIGYYLSSYLSFWGLEYVSVGLERLILFLNPTVVLLLGMVFYQRRVSRQQWLSMALAYAGIVLVFWNDTHTAQAGTGAASAANGRVLIGALIVFASALTYGLYLLLSGEAVKRYGSLRLVSLAMLVSTVYTMIHYSIVSAAAGTGGLRHLWLQSGTVWALSGVNAVFCTVIPVTLLMVAVSRLGAGTAAQAGMVGPVATIFLAYGVLGEAITPLQLAGTALVMAGMVVLGRIKVSH
jgi:drug/metabolite transporter (DMT)-like permease